MGGDTFGNRNGGEYADHIGFRINQAITIARHMVRAIYSQGLSCSETGELMG
jgi:hypothetical protein